MIGDEGKGKLVDVLLSSGHFKLVARCVRLLDVSLLDAISEVECTLYLILTA